MSKPNLENSLERAERILRELREATAEAAGVRKDMDSTIRSARATIEIYLHDEVQREINRITAEWQGILDHLHADWQKKIDTAMKSIFAELEQTALDVCNALSQYDPAAYEVFQAVRGMREKGAAGEALTDIQGKINLFLPLNHPTPHA